MCLVEDEEAHIEIPILVLSVSNASDDQTSLKLRLHQDTDTQRTFLIVYTLHWDRIRCKYYT